MSEYIMTMMTFIWLIAAFFSLVMVFALLDEFGLWWQSVLGILVASFLWAPIIMGGNQ